MKAFLNGLLIILFASIVSGQSGNAGGENAAGTTSTEQTRSSGQVSCTVTADPPIGERDDSRISASVRYRCDRPGADVELTVYLQKREANAAWTTVANAQVAANGVDTTRERTEAKRTHTASAACADGAYRTFTRGTATVKGQPKSIEMASSTATNPCKSLRSR